MTRKSLIERRMKKTPRAAYCTGCGVTFEKRHELMNHRNTEKCGGRFLPAVEREFLDRLRVEREEQLRMNRIMEELSASFS